ncbi:TPA: hypothetical protein PXM37_004396 [Yersinia enterocolitica]|nr:hypothetical protein [Yersinia enterocolitica]HDL6983949.1 hypothetical protein [Yersinia enterocolitica]HDL7063892.1 hypothetical protein [Yersinia enterocolitica]HDL7067943.1 hypothetical protein [Yersinia enterocolitica]HDL7068273.1 hypothetical protein [Yersinia enterocolitica]
MSQVISVTMARPSEDEVKSLWKLLHATEAAEDRWHRESSEQFLERLDEQDISDEERTFIAIAWDSLVQGHGGFGRFMGAYDTLIHNFQDPDADYVATHPKFNTLLTESELLPVVLEGYHETKNIIVDLEKKNQILAAENIQLQEKAARELSGAWLINRLAIGSIAALALIQAGRLIDARDWLLENLEGVDIDIPSYQSDTQLNDWANTHQVGHLNHGRALEIIKQQMPATTQIFNEAMAQGVELAADGFHESVFSAIEDNGVIKPLLYVRADLMQFAANLRGKQNA